MEQLRLLSEPAEQVELGIQEPQWVTSQLIRISDDAGPLWGALAGAADSVVAVIKSIGKEVDVNRNRRARISVVGDIGNTAMGIERFLKSLSHQRLVRRF